MLSMADSRQSTAHSSATDSNFKRRKLSKGEAKFNYTIDRISSLPDSVLGHILSFLPTKQSVATGVLSTRWRYVWTLVPTLDFDDAAVINPVRRDGDGVRYLSFVHFVDRVLVLRKNASCIKTFRLKCSKKCNSSHFNVWVCAAIERKAEELDLCMSIRRPIKLPRSLFSCKTLKVLKLSGTIVLNVPSKSVHFPILKILHLNSVKYISDDSFQKLLSGCPVVEDLFIQTSCHDGGQIFNISAPALKNLTVTCAHPRYPKVAQKLEINAPALEYLNLKGYLPQDFSIENLSYLVEANVDVRKEWWEHDEDNGLQNQEFMLLLKVISNAKRLSLSVYNVELLRYATNIDLPMFHNLTRLELEMRSCNSHVLLNLLESSHNLEVLNLKCIGRLKARESCWRQPLHVPKCLLLHLMRIDIRGFHGFKDELKLVRYILKNAKVLKRMNISAEGSLEERFRLLKKISMCPRGSKACQVAFD